MKSSKKRKTKVWVVTCKVPDNSGGGEHIAAVETSLRGAQIAALNDIADYWVQGEWGVYEDNDVKDLRRLVAYGDYAGALTMWESMSSYEVFIEETTLNRTLKKDLDMNQWGEEEVEEKRMSIVDGDVYCADCIADEDENACTDLTPGQQSDEEKKLDLQKLAGKAMTAFA